MLEAKIQKLLDRFVSVTDDRVPADCPPHPSQWGPISMRISPRPSASESESRSSVSGNLRLQSLPPQMFLMQPRVCKALQ